MPAPIKPIVTSDVLEAIDFRVGTIESMHEIEGADRLVRLVVSFGDQRRRIVAGLRQEREDPYEIVSKQALFVVNLEPKRIRGELSEGMLFDIGYADGIQPVLAVPESPVPDGTRAG